MLSTKRFQRLLKSSRLQRFFAVAKLHSLASKQSSVESSPNDTNLSRDQVLEIYDWISQIKSQSKSA